MRRMWETSLRENLPDSTLREAERERRLHPAKSSSESFLVDCLREIFIHLSL
jgi:hypothetical protein